MGINQWQRPFQFHKTLGTNCSSPSPDPSSPWSFFPLILLPPDPSSSWSFIPIILLPSGLTFPLQTIVFFHPYSPLPSLQSCLSVFVTMAKRSFEGSDALHNKNKNRRVADDDFDKQRALYVTFLILITIQAEHINSMDYCWHSFPWFPPIEWCSLAHVHHADGSVTLREAICAVSITRIMNRGKYLTKPITYMHMQR